MMRIIPICLLATLGLAAPWSASPAQDNDLTQIKERELEAVRDKISTLKTSMDKRATERDRITGELQTAEASIAEKRTHLKELERQRDFSERKKADLDAQLEVKETELAGGNQAAGVTGRCRLYERQPGTNQVAPQSA